MSYHPSISRRRHPIRRAPRSPLAGLGSWFDDVVAGLTGQSGTLDAAQQVCLQSVQGLTPALEQRISDVQNGWNPTGYYTPDDFGTIIQTALQLASSAKDQLISAPVADSDSMAKIYSANDAITEQTQRGLKLIQQLNAAKAANAKYVDAVGLKSYVIDSMTASYQGFIVASTMVCDSSWVATALGVFQAGFDQVWAVVAKIAGYVAKAGDLVYSVASDAFDLVTWIKWGAIIGGGLWLAMELSDKYSDVKSKRS